MRMKFGYILMVLCRCNLHEIEILDSNKKDYEAHYSLLSNYASRMIDGNYFNEDEEEIQLEFFMIDLQ